jgi:hypothetical protein
MTESEYEKAKELNPFFVKVLKRSSFTYQENKKWVGKIVQVTIDPINPAYYLFYPPLPIQQLCKSDGNYSRKGYIYGLAVCDCEVITNPDKESCINEAWEQFKKELPVKAPDHFTLKSLSKLRSELTDTNRAIDPEYHKAVVKLADDLRSENIELKNQLSASESIAGMMALGKYPDLAGLSDEEKKQMIGDFTQLTSKYFLELFLMLDLKSHIETMVVNTATGQEYILSFQTVERFKEKFKTK